jgi:cellulose synthase/poly-beta-1,6-N-acetylglucosamine synthase-like glycosyltransferase
MDAVILVGTIAPAILVLFVLIGVVAAATRGQAAAPGSADAARPARVAIVIASRNGERTIGSTIGSAREQGDIFVVSDASTDCTADAARAEGAEVLELETNVGKPTAIYRLVKTLELTRRYETILILDDDTIIAPNFVSECLKQLNRDVAIVVGRTITRWEHANRWNVWLGCRAYAYWRYQATIRRGQSALNVLNCISGSNSIYRSKLLDAVLSEHTPYIVDDTYWTLETHRRKLGRIVYAPEAHAWICDPLSFRAWYRQNLRWLWGTFQGVWGHRIGRQATRFDLFYLLLIMDWILYATFAPLVFTLLFLQDWFEPIRGLALYSFGVFVWVGIAAAATKQWRLVLMTPAIVAVDWIYRFTFLHAFAKTLAHPRVDVCRWQSPVRY